MDNERDSQSRNSKPRAIEILLSRLRQNFRFENLTYVWYYFQHSNSSFFFTTPLLQLTVAKFFFDSILSEPMLARKHVQRT